MKGLKGISTLQSLHSITTVALGTTMYRSLLWEID